MTNREKFKEVFGKDIKWSEAIEPQMLALKSAQINGIDCMEEWLNAEYKEPTTKNDLGVDAISREQALNEFCIYNSYDSIGVDKVRSYLKALPPVTPQEPTTKIEESNFSQEQYLADIQSAYDCGKSVIDKIRAEIETKYGQCDICEYFEDYDYEENDISEYRPIGDIADILQIIDKYKGEVEPQENEEQTEGK